MPLRKALSWLFAIAGSLTLAGLAAYAAKTIVLNYDGYCFEEHRFLTDAEKYRLVVERIVRSGVPFEPVKVMPPGRNYWSPGNKISHWVIKGYDGPVTPIYYLSANDFFSRNPDCCEMRTFVSTSEGGFAPSFWDRALGDSSGGVVRVAGIAHFRDQSGVERHINFVWEDLLSNCGRELSVPTLEYVGRR